jgi:hypothetical protein
MTPIEIIDDITRTRRMVSVLMTRGEIIEAMTWLTRGRRRRKSFLTLCCHVYPDRLALHVSMPNWDIIGQWIEEAYDELRAILGDADTRLQKIISDGGDDKFRNHAEGGLTT